MKKEDWKLYQRQSILADWYGSDFAFTEMAAHTPEPVSIGRELDAFWRKAIGADAADIEILKQNWPRIVGEKLAGHSNILRFDGVKLIVKVDHPAWQMELRRMKKLICTRINGILTKEKVTEISFFNSSVGK